MSEMSKQTTATYVYAFNEEGPFYGEYNQFEDALREASSYYDELSHVYIGELSPHSCRPYLDIDNLLVRADEKAFDARRGAHGEDSWADRISPELVKQLTSLVADFLDEHAPMPRDVVNVRQVPTRQTD